MSKSYNVDIAQFPDYLAPRGSFAIFTPYPIRLHAQNVPPYFYEKVLGTDVFGINYGNTNNFLDNPSKNTQN